MPRPQARLRCLPLEDRLTPDGSSIGPFMPEPPPRVITVTTADDVDDANDGVTSLREAIAESRTPTPPDVWWSEIRFAPALAGATITVSQVGGTLAGAAAFEITQGSLRIAGSGQKIIRAASAPEFRLFSVVGPQNVTQFQPAPHLWLKDVELIGGDSSGAGGAVYVKTGLLSAWQTVFADNTSTGAGGAVFVEGGVSSFVRSVFTGNVARPTAGGISQGGAIAFTVTSYFPTPTPQYLAIEYSTLVGNTATQGAQVYADRTVSGYSNVEVEYSILYSQQPAGATVADLVVHGNAQLANPEVATRNLIGRAEGTNLVPGFNWDVVSTADPLLGPLQDNGGPTRSMLPLPGSPAIDNAARTNDGWDDGLLYYETDQRGYYRTVGLRADLGSVEFGADADTPAPPPAPPVDPPPVVPPTGGGEINVPPPPPTTSPTWVGLATGAAAGQPPEVVVYGIDGTVIHRFLAYAPGFLGGVNVAVGDVTGDGMPDIVTGAGVGGAPHVKVFDGITFAEIRSFFAFDAGLRGGVSLAVGEVTGDGVPDIVTGAGAGGAPHVKVFDGKTGGVVKSFFAYDLGFHGGVNVAVQPTTQNRYEGAAGDRRQILDGTIVTGVGAGGAPHVKVFDADTLSERYSFLAFDAGFLGGVNVASDGWGGILTGAGAGGGAHVKLFGYGGYGPDRKVQIAEVFVADGITPSGVRVSYGFELADTLVTNARGETEARRFRFKTDYAVPDGPVTTVTELPDDETDWGRAGSLAWPTWARFLAPTPVPVVA